MTVGLPEALVLTSYPNPFNPQATVEVAVAQAQEATVALYDVLGRRVKTLFEGPLAANEAHRFTLDGATLPSGTYFVRFEGTRATATRRVLLVK